MTTFRKEGGEKGRKKKRILNISCAHSSIERPNHNHEKFMLETKIQESKNQRHYCMHVYMYILGESTSMGVLEWSAQRAFLSMFLGSFFSIVTILACADSIQSKNNNKKIQVCLVLRRQRGLSLRYMQKPYGTCVQG